MTSLGHIINRCRQEGPRNACRFAIRRLQAPLKREYLRRKYLRGAFYGTRGRSLQDRPTGRFFFSTEDLGDLAGGFRRHYPENLAALVDRADRIVRHQFNWLCPNCPEFGARIGWTNNFPDQRPWPMTLYSELDYASEARLGDVREIWELNRHQYFTTLGKAYALTGEDRYAEAFLAQLFDWIEHNPPGYGINWLDAQEVALRGVAWCWAYAFFAAYPGFSEPRRELFFRALCAHADFVRWHLSDKPVTHNHLVTEACGLAVIGLMFPHLPGAATWRRCGLKIFQREIIKQVWEDGLDGELSTNYHCFVLDSFLQLALLMQVNGLTVPAEVLKRIEKMVEAVMYLLRPDGSLPLVGDNDSGRAFRVGEQPPDDRRSLLAIGAVMFARPDFKWASAGFPEEAFWLLGSDGERAFTALAEREPSDSGRCFRAGGLGTSRTAWQPDADFILFRGGPTRYRPGVSTSHNHADLLSFELFLRGRRVLVDPGVYLYGREDRWRFHFRKTGAHSTLMVDGRDQFEVSATRFGIPFLPLSRINAYRDDADEACFDMQHSGYADQSIGHRRRLFWKKGRYLLILDELTGGGVHRVDMNFQFSPRVTVVREKAGFAVGDQSGVALCTLQPAKAVPAAGTPTGESEVALSGWVAERYGQLQPASQVTWRADLALPVRLLTVINTCPAQDLAIEMTAEEGGKLAMSVDGDGSADHYRIDAESWRSTSAAAEGGRHV